MKLTSILLLICLIASSATAFKVNVLTREEVGDGLTCAICHFVANVVIDKIEQNASVSDIMTALNQECGSLYNAQWISECRSFVSTEGQKIIPYIKTNPGGNACVYIGACSSDDKNTHSLHHDVIPPYHKPAPVKGEIECGVCTFVATRVEYYLASNHSESEIEGLLAKDCRVFRDKSWIATCQGLVDEFAPEIIQLAENKYPADVICQDIKFCNASTITTHKKQKPVVPLPAIKSDDDNIKCHVCEWIANVAEKYIEENKTESEIIDTLADSCDVLIEKSWISECKSLVEENGEEIVEYLLEKETPEEVCEEIQACPSNFSAAIKELLAGQKNVGDVECSVCHWLTTLGEKYVADNKTESEIIDGLAASCDILIEKSWITSCHEIVQENGDLIVQYLLNKESPSVICQQIGLCNSTVSSPAAIDESVECSVCNWVATLAERYIEQNKTETEIIDALSIACDVLIDKTYIDKCDTLVEENGEEIVQYLLAKEDPEEVCEQIQACPSNSSSPVVSVPSALRLLTPLLQKFL